MQMHKLKLKKKLLKRHDSAGNVPFMLWPDQFQKNREIKAWYYRILDLKNPLRFYNGPPLTHIFLNYSKRLYNWVSVAAITTTSETGSKLVRAVCTGTALPLQVPIDVKRIPLIFCEISVGEIHLFYHKKLCFDFQVSAPLLW